MNEYLKRFTKPMAKRQSTILHKRAYSKTLKIEVDDDDYLERVVDSYDSISIYSVDDEEELHLEATHLDDIPVSLPSDRELESAVEAQVTVAPAAKYLLSPLETVCIDAVLKDALDQLATIVPTLPPAVAVDSPAHRTLAQRYDGPAPRRLQFPAEGPAPVETHRDKCQRVCKYLGDVLRKTNAEIQNRSSFTVLREAVDADWAMRGEGEGLRGEAEGNARAVRELRSKREELARLVEQTKMEFRTKGKLKEAMHHDALFMSAMERNATERWEASRAEQAKYLRERNAFNLERDLNMTRVGIDEEYRVNGEVETYINMIQNDLSDSLDTWQQLYEQDLEDKDKELLQMAVEREALSDRFLEMQETISKRKEEIDSYLEEREEKRILRELQLHEELREAMAVRIQVWWRNVMKVRKLGPYKKKKGKKGKGKEKGKGKGKK